ncbi:hypothetical protein D3C71_1953620 [compost metagenome]
MQSSNAMSMYWPRPETVRCWSADSMAIVEYIPVMTSAIAIPAFCGPPPGSASASPVMLINPPTAWNTKS